jgi:cell fate regulator YaaT (PSP1 superfamily)
VEHLIEVSFKGNRREFFRWSFEAPPPVHAAIIVDVERGEDLGRVHATGDLAQRRRAGTTHGKEQREPLRPALRLAAMDDIAKAAVLRHDEEHARRFAVQKARALNLQMKVSDAEWQWDRRRLTFYFTAEERVDFRGLVRQLETHFGVRVQMWHIGPRDEAKRLDGVGHCGRQLCSSSWLPELLPVKTSLAKEQRLSTITPTQISGACGRLMCCLRYEHEFYVQARKRFPKQGKIVQTLQGEEKIDATDIFRDLVILRNPSGELRTISLAQFKRELAGETMPVDDEVHEHDEEAEDTGEERTSTRAPSPAPATQLKRAAASRPEPRAAEPAKPAESRKEPRRESRGEPRRESRGEPRRDPRGETRRESRSEPRREPRPDLPVEARPTTDQRPAPTVVPPAATVAASAPPPIPRESLLAPAVATDGPEASPGDAEQRRSRRRRGRRGGRRHRGDHNQGNGGPSGPPEAPPKTTDG